MSIEKIKSNSIDISGLGAKTKNLWNPDAVSMDYYLATNGTTLVSSVGYAVSEMIEVEPSTSYVYSYNFKTQYILSGSLSYYYDSSGAKISAIGDNNNPFTTPSNCKYIRVTIFYQSMGGLDHAMLEKGSTVGYYVPYGLKSDYPEIFHSRWFGKKYVPIGDSITDQTLYPIRVAQALGMVYSTNLGKGGATIWCDATQDSASFSSTSCIGALSRIDALPSDTEVITIMGGSNDALQNKTLGTIDDANMYTITSGVVADVMQVVRVPTTILPTSPNFYNCYAMLLNRIAVKAPNARVMLCEMPLRSMQAYELSGSVYNGNKIDTYRDAVAIIAKKYGLPLIKTYQKAGINELNFETYLNHTINDHGIHPNSVGHERLAKVVIAEMKSIEV